MGFVIDAFLDTLADTEVLAVTVTDNTSATDALAVATTAGWLAALLNGLKIQDDVSFVPSDNLFGERCSWPNEAVSLFSAAFSTRDFSDEVEGEPLCSVTAPDVTDTVSLSLLSSGGSSEKIRRGLSSIGAILGAAVAERCNIYEGRFSGGRYPAMSVTVVTEEEIDSRPGTGDDVVFRHEKRSLSNASASCFALRNSVGDSLRNERSVSFSERYSIWMLERTSCSSRPNISI